jgi:hypothetical protein
LTEIIEEQPIHPLGDSDTDSQYQIREIDEEVCGMFIDILHAIKKQYPPRHPARKGI